MISWSIEMKHRRLVKVLIYLFRGAKYIGYKPLTGLVCSLSRWFIARFCLTFKVRYPG